jgi:hypothetical protein
LVNKNQTLISRNANRSKLREPLSRAELKTRDTIRALSAAGYGSMRNDVEKDHEE